MTLIRRHSPLGEVPTLPMHGTPVESTPVETGANSES